MGDDKAYISRIPRDGGTAWGRYSVEQLWEMVRHEGSTINGQQYDAWRRMAVICNDQADQLDLAVNRLLEKWPARPGSAAETFAAWMRDLTSSMRQSADGALKAREAISSDQHPARRGPKARSPGWSASSDGTSRPRRLCIPQPMPHAG